MTSRAFVEYENDRDDEESAGADRTTESESSDEDEKTLDEIIDTYAN